MKEVTEWDNKPRWMWVWDDDEKGKEKRYVTCILTEEEMKEAEAEYPVCAYNLNYKHCAEIEEETTRLTNYELSQLLKCFGVECSTIGKVTVQNFFIYEQSKDNNNALNTFIRYKQGEWEKSTRETVWKWWDGEIPGSDITRFVSFMDWDKV